VHTNRTLNNNKTLHKLLSQVKQRSRGLLVTLIAAKVLKTFLPFKETEDSLPFSKKKKKKKTYLKKKQNKKKKNTKKKKILKEM
jgi:Tfp pilus assembly protein PilP